MITLVIYISATILGTLLGMSYIGFRYYKRRYTDIKSKYDAIDGEYFEKNKKEIERLNKTCEDLTKENESLKKSKKIKKRRRGLLSKSLLKGDTHSFKVECEVVEVDRSKNKSKIEVLDINCDEILDEKIRIQIKELTNGWFDSDEIKWFERPLDEVRDDAISDILDDEEDKK